MHRIASSSRNLVARCSSLKQVVRSVSAHNSSFTRSLPGVAFTNPEAYEAERQFLLGHSWQLLGLEAQLLPGSDASPATYIAETVCGWPTIVVRSSKTGQLNAYHNVCRHKAGKNSHQQW
jgi:phenylpropionate dioxygenase-like ring-hydroxylating dioxygenase large terminal subunit